MDQRRNVFFLSDGTGITAETLGGTLLTQFEGLAFEKVTLPFINTSDKARATVEYINHVADNAAMRPIVFSTTVSDDIRGVLRSARALFLDLFDSLIPPLEMEIGQKSSHAQGRAHSLADSNRYNARIAAMNYAMEHDDGQSARDLARAEVILVAPSRCGKTPTSLYLALQQGIYATNFPLTEDDLSDLKLPRTLSSYRDRLFGLTSQPERLHQVRNERRPGSRYASLAQCVYELRQAEELYRRHNIPFLDSSNMSIEEIAATIIQERQLRR